MSDRKENKISIKHFQLGVKTSWLQARVLSTRADKLVGSFTWTREHTSPKPSDSVDWKFVVDVSEPEASAQLWEPKIHHPLFLAGLALPGTSQVDTGVTWGVTAAVFYCHLYLILTVNFRARNHLGFYFSRCSWFYTRLPALPNDRLRAQLKFYLF